MGQLYLVTVNQRVLGICYFSSTCVWYIWKVLATLFLLQECGGQGLLLKTSLSFFRFPALIQAHSLCVWPGVSLLPLTEQKWFRAELFFPKSLWYFMFVGLVDITSATKQKASHQLAPITHTLPCDTLHRQTDLCLAVKPRQGYLHDAGCFAIIHPAASPFLRTARLFHYPTHQSTSVCLAACWIVNIGLQFFLITFTNGWFVWFCLLVNWKWWWWCGKIKKVVGHAESSSASYTD